MGNLDDKTVLKTFHGARVTKYMNGAGVEVNQGSHLVFIQPHSLLSSAIRSIRLDIRRERQPATLIFTERISQAQWMEMETVAWEYSE